jgi:hypothetical protein
MEYPKHNKKNWVTSCLGNCLLESVTEGNIEVKERRERRCKQLLDDDKKKRK